MENSLEKNRYFYGLPTRTIKDQRYFNQNVQLINHIEGKNDQWMDMDLYKGKYIYSESNDKEDLIWNKKFKQKIDSLTLLCYGMKEIRYLPPGLQVLYVQGPKSLFKFDVSVIPKSIVSIQFTWANFPFNGRDLSHLTNLKVMNAPRNHFLNMMPKFPKTIEYIDFRDGGLGLFEDKSLKEFKFKDYPNLKYFNVSGNRILKIPEAWKKAKKLGKIIIKYGKQRKA